MQNRREITRKAQASAAGTARNVLLPSHGQLFLPVLNAVDKLGGSAAPCDVIAEVANALELPDEVRDHRGEVSGREEKLFDKRVRWVRQDAGRRGFLSATEYRRWQLTVPGKNFLDNIKPGFVITIYETEHGVALWAEAEAAAAVIADNSINLIITSPEYPLAKPKAYGNRTDAELVEWLTELAFSWKRMLVDTGSLVLNVGPVWQRGLPVQSVYEERLLLRLIDDVGLHLAQRYYWENPSKVPSSEWVTIRRVRVRNVIEKVWHLSKTPHPKADNRRVLVPYSDRMKKLIAKGGQQRATWENRTPSGHSGSRGGFGKDNGGMIPTTLIRATNSASADFYHRKCKEHGLPAHPATFAEGVPEYFINFLTDPGDIVYDPLSGSGKVGKVCERLGREWITSDRALTYVSGSKFNMPSYTNTAPWLCPI